MSVTEPAVPPRSSNATAIAAVVVLVAFVAGLLVGAVADRIYLFRHPRPMGPRAADFMASRIVERLDRELHLTPQQKQQVAQIVGRHGKRMESIWSNVRPQVHQEIEAANVEIAAQLTPDQRARFAKMRMRMMPRRGGPRGFGAGPPPPPD